MENKEEIAEDDKPLEQRVKEGIQRFDKLYFHNLEQYIESEINWLEVEKLEQKNKADYFGLRRFLYTAINNMQEIDLSIKSGIFEKLKLDLDQLYGYYDEFILMTRYPQIIYNDHFLPRFAFYHEVKQSLDDSTRQRIEYDATARKAQSIIDVLNSKRDKTTKEQEQLKAARRQSADALHMLEKYKNIVSDAYDEEQDLNKHIADIFMPNFEKKSKEITAQIIKIINIKSFCLDQALWYYSEKSKTIKNFFKASNIKGDFSLATYISYYLKNLDDETVINDNDVRFLKQAIINLKESA